MLSWDKEQPGQLASLKLPSSHNSVTRPWNEHKTLSKNTGDVLQQMTRKDKTAALTTLMAVWRLRTLLGLLSTRQISSNCTFVWSLERFFDCIDLWSFNQNFLSSSFSLLNPWWEYPQKHMYSLKLIGLKFLSKILKSFNTSKSKNPTKSF